jgi:hypothetical protein
MYIGGKTITSENKRANCDSLCEKQSFCTLFEAMDKHFVIFQTVQLCNAKQ